MTAIKRINASHGAGGRMMHSLIRDIFVAKFNNPILNTLSDSAIIKIGQQPDALAFTTDSYTVTPLFFPGGDIGKLAVCGTVNDLAVSGAIPVCISLAMIVEEGFEISLLEEISDSISRSACEAGVNVVTGDFKVVERGKGDGIYINSSGIGLKKDGYPMGQSGIRPGDRIIVNGTLGDHEISVLIARDRFKMQADIRSDAAPLNRMINDMMEASPGIRMMKDPTRGGVATSLNEMASGADFGITIYEKMLPVKENVLSICEILGFDYLYLANEGKVITVCDKTEADKIVGVMRRHEYGRQAGIIGEVVKKPEGKVIIETLNGSSRMLNMLSGSQLPRIC